MTIDTTKLVDALKEELKTYQKAKAKRNPELAQDAIAWHVCDTMITWLKVHIEMIEGGSYDFGTGKGLNR